MVPVEPRTAGTRQVKRVLIMKTEIKIPVETYDRVVGYYRPVDQWNPGKQAEFSERKRIDIERALRQMDFRKAPGD